MLTTRSDMLITTSDMLTTRHEIVTHVLLPFLFLQSSATFSLYRKPSTSPSFPSATLSSPSSSSSSSSTDRASVLAVSIGELSVWLLAGKRKLCWRSRHSLYGALWKRRLKRNMQNLRVYGFRWDLTWNFRGKSLQVMWLNFIRVLVLATCALVRSLVASKHQLSAQNCHVIRKQMANCCLIHSATKCFLDQFPFEYL